MEPQHVADRGAWPVVIRTSNLTCDNLELALCDAVPPVRDDSHAIGTDDQ